MQHAHHGQLLPPAPTVKVGSKHTGPRAPVKPGTGPAALASTIPAQSRHTGRGCQVGALSIDRSTRVSCSGSQHVVYPDLLCRHHMPQAAPRYGRAPADSSSAEPFASCYPAASCGLKWQLQLLGGKSRGALAGGRTKSRALMSML